jgi:uncharacterized membrane protein (DUF106 family)
MAWADFEDTIRTPPNSLWFIFVVSLGVSLISTILNKLLVDHKQIERVQKVITAHSTKKKELVDMAEENPKKYAKEYIKWQRRDKSIQKMQQSMSMSRLKPTCFTFIPMIVFFYLIRAIYTGPGGIQMSVAKPAMNPMDDLPDFLVNMLRSEFYSAVGYIPVHEGFLGFTGYYILCSVSLSTVMQKVFGISKPKGKGSMGSMFDTTAQMDLPAPV